MSGEARLEDCNTLEEVRAHIDLLDKAIVPLLCERNHYVQQAAKIKGDVDVVRVPVRIEGVVSKVRAIALERGTDPDVVEAIYRAMIEVNIALEKRQITDPDVTS